MPENNILDGYPRTFDKCPHCGSEKRFIKDALGELLPEGTPVQTNVGLQVIQAGLQGPLVAYMCLATMDACVECGTIFAVNLDIKRASFSIQPGGPGAGPKIPFSRG